MRNLSAALITALLLSSCSLAPDYARPETALPTAWSIEQKQQAAIAADWWKGFGSQSLDSLMLAALENNHDLRAGVQRVAQARATAKIAGADLFPTLGGDAGASKTRTNPASGKTTTNTSLSAGLDAAYELDLFGGNRNAADSAALGADATAFDEDALRLVVMGDVARTYFTILSLRERVAIAQSNLKASREIERIIRAQREAGTQSELEVVRQSGVVSTREATLASLEQQMAAAENALAVLIGRAPQTVEFDGKSLDGLTVPNIAAGQPADLLQRRPDMRAAESRLIAAHADIGVARAAMFPSLSLGTGAGLSLPGFGDPSTTIMSLAASLVVPLFQGGRLEGGVERTTARQRELAELYVGESLTAMQEGEDALSAVKAAWTRESAFSDAAANARRAYEITRARYDAGNIDFQTLLDAQSEKLSAEDSLAQARLARLTAATDLYMALGGGWEG
jgi:NodT family efflux transporter outer membrane factor (OMF) lipoprotein